MKKLYISVFALLSFVGYAQEAVLNDLVRLSNENLSGTARYRAMGGAFGAVGADLSAISINPAGSALFSTNLFAATLTSYNKNNNSTYFGTSNKTSKSAIDMNQIGGVLVFEDNSKYAEWNKFTLGINYDNVGKFNNYTFASGKSDQSVVNYFLDKAQGLNSSFLSTQAGETITSLYRDLGEGLASSQGFYDQQAFLGFQSFIIDTNGTTPSNTDYISNVPTGVNPFQQSNTVNTRGYNGKMAVNFAAEYNKKLYIGMNLNFNFVDITKTTSLTEKNTNPVFNTGFSIRNLTFNNELYTYGSGFSVQLGAIYKVNEEFRVGFNYDSPTWYRLTDELTQSVSTNFVQALNTNPVTFVDDSAIVAPDVVNVFPVYNITSPSKITGSAAYLFGKKGLISIDYGYKNYAGTNIRPGSDVLFSSITNQAKNLLTSAKEIKIGAEARLTKQFSLRGGYRLDESPYKNKDIMGDLKSFSGGFGYSWDNNRFDMAYTNEKRNTTDAFLSSGFNYGSTIKNNAHNITLTYTIVF